MNRGTNRHPSRSGTVTGAPVGVRTLRSAERAAAERLWRELEAELGAPSLACSWTWTGTWLRHYAPVVPHRFVVAEQDGRPVGIALVTEGSRRRPRLLGARIAHLGTAGEPPGESVFVERNRLLVADAAREGFATALLRDLHGDRRWDRLALPGLHPVDAEALRRAEPGLEWQHEDSPVAELPGEPGGDVLAALGRGARQRARRTLRHFGALTTEWAGDVAHAGDILDELIALHERRWRLAGQPGAFASGRFRAFHRDLVATLVPAGRAALVRVRRDGETVGCVYGLVEGRRLLFYQSGMRRYEDNRLRAGVAVHVSAMQACVGRGIAEYDFLAPASRYKLELATRSDRLLWATLPRRRVRARLDLRMLALRDVLARRRAAGALSSA